MMKTQNWKTIRELRKAVKEGSLDRGAFQFLLGVSTVIIDNALGREEKEEAVGSTNRIGFVNEESDD